MKSLILFTLILKLLSCFFCFPLIQGGQIFFLKIHKSITIKGTEVPFALNAMLGCGICFNNKKGGSSGSSKGRR